MEPFEDKKFVNKMEERMRIRLSLAVILLALTGCIQVPLCAEREYSVTLPASIPFMDGVFSFKTSNDHVDCELDPSDRGINSGNA